MGAFDKIVAEASRPECSVTLCTAGALNARLQELERELADEHRKAVTSLAEGGRRQELATQIESVIDEMRAHEHTFTFRGLPHKAWSDLTAEHKPRDGKNEAVNLETFPAACITSSLVQIDGDDVQVSLEEVDAFFDVLNEGQIDQLFNAAWEANTGGRSVPFSGLASAILRNTDTKS
jgi:hypothetical protein